MNRRAALKLAAAGWVALPVAVARSQPPRAGAEPRLIAFLAPGTSGFSLPILDELAGRLKSLGYEVGRDVMIEPRFANRDLAMLPALARELVSRKPAVIVVVGSPGAIALKAATSTIPIVMSGSTNPVETGLVASLARPGGNITGNTASQPEIAGKLVEILKTAAPKVSRVAVTWNPDVPGMKLYSLHADRTARALGIALHYVDVRRPDDFTLEMLERIRAQALYVTWDSVVSAIADPLIQFATQRKLPSIGVLRYFVERGGLFSLSPDPNELEAVVADYVDRILTGAAPANLPVQQPSRFQLTINRATAHAIGLALAPELVLRAHELIG